MKKIINYNDFPEFLNEIHSRGTLVLVGGVFDILHPGHTAFFVASKKQGDTLLVMLESDEAVKKRKGKERPINSQQARAENVSAIPEVDAVLLLPNLKTDLEYYDLVKRIQPDIIAVTQSDPAYNKKVEQAKMVNGKVVVVTQRLPFSTTELVKKR